MPLPTTIAGCVLRPWSPADKESLLRYANNRKIWRNLTDMFPHPYTEADADAWFKIAAQDGPSVQWAIGLNGEAVGGVGLTAGEGVYRYSAEFGYWLAEPFWGRGITTAAARAAVEFAFSQTEFVRLEAAVFEWNPASMRVLEKIGFERECVRPRSVFKDGELIASVMYVALRQK
jgi:ribosomal-protein-alanine N-acetyltransferase